LGSVFSYIIYNWITNRRGFGGFSPQNSIFRQSLKIQTQFRKLDCLVIFYFISVSFRILRVHLSAVIFNKNPCWVGQTTALPPVSLAPSAFLFPVPFRGKYNMYPPRTTIPIPCPCSPLALLVPNSLRVIKTHHKNKVCFYALV
jgi:hypothetical protein